MRDLRISNIPNAQDAHQTTAVLSAIRDTLNSVWHSVKAMVRTLNNTCFASVADILVADCEVS
jgi:hypothetical protein